MNPSSLPIEIIGIAQDSVISQTATNKLTPCDERRFLRVNQCETSMTRSELLQFMRSYRYAVQTSVSSSGLPQAAVVGIAVTNELCLIFDTLNTSRKAQNLRQNPKIAFVIGGLDDGDERTIQYEGLADEPEGEELTLLKRTYFAQFPDGPERQSWHGIMYVRVRPTWIRYSDYSKTPPEIVEFNSDQLNRLVGDQNF